MGAQSELGKRLQASELRADMKRSRDAAIEQATVHLAVTPDFLLDAIGRLWIELSEAARLRLAGQEQEAQELEADVTRNGEFFGEEILSREGGNYNTGLIEQFLEQMRDQGLLTAQQANSLILMVQDPQVETNALSRELDMAVTERLLRAERDLAAGRIAQALEAVRASEDAVLAARRRLVNFWTRFIAQLRRVDP